MKSSVIKSKNRKIKISDIYTCDKRRRVKEGEKKPAWSSLTGCSFYFTLFHGHRKSDSSECGAPGGGDQTGADCGHQ